MVKKPAPKRPRPSFGVKNALGRVGEIVKIAVQHPTAACLTVMVATSVSRLAILSGSKKEDLFWNSGLGYAYWSSHDPKTDALLGELSGLYNGAQGLGLAAALAPVASQGLGVLGQALSPKKGAQ